MKTDLRNLVTAEEAYFSDNTTYTTTLLATQFNVSKGDHYAVTNATGTGWEATATTSISWARRPRVATLRSVPARRRRPRTKAPRTARN